MLELSDKSSAFFPSAQAMVSTRADYLQEMNLEYDESELEEALLTTHNFITQIQARKEAYMLDVAAKVALK